MIVIADCKGQLWGNDKISVPVVEALFGDEIVKVRGGSNGTLTRKPNGFWGRSSAPRNKNVSGVLILKSANLWTLRSNNYQPLLAINPWAEHPLSERFISLQRMAIEDDTLMLHDGDIIADILGLPIPWPPQEGD